MVAIMVTGGRVFFKIFLSPNGLIHECDKSLVNRYDWWSTSKLFQLFALPRHDHTVKCEYRDDNGVISEDCFKTASLLCYDVHHSFNRSASPRKLVLTMELQERLLSLQKELSTPRQIAFYRIKLLEEENDDVNGPQPQACLASMLVPLLKDTLTAWLAQPIIMSALLSEMAETTNLRLVLQLHLHVTKMNPSLGEELGRQGSHAPLVKLMNLDLAPYSGTNIDGDGDIDEANQDTVIELQDLACEIAALASSFPVKVAPFCAHGLRQRLPLVFSIGAVPVESVPDSKTSNGRGGYEKSSMVAETETVLIHQVTTRQSAQEDVGFGT